MKRIEYILLAVAAAAVFSCSEDKLDVYHGDNYIHFSPLDNGNPLSVTYNFALSGNTAQTEADVPLEITLWGYLPEKPFAYSVAVLPDGTTASAGDFDEPSSGVFRSSLPVDTLFVRVRRNAELLATSYEIKLELTDAEGHVIGPQKYSAASIKVTDSLSEPSWWNLSFANRLGEYSDMKYRVFNIYLGRVLTSLDGYTAISFSEEISSFKSWWRSRWAEGEYRYFASDGVTPLYDTISD